MTIFTTIPTEKKEAENDPDAQLLVSSKVQIFFYEYAHQFVTFNSG